MITNTYIRKGKLVHGTKVARQILKNDVFGCLRVTIPNESGASQALSVCKCDCGREVSISRNYLVWGTHVHCGPECRLRSHTRFEPLPETISLLNSVFGIIVPRVEPTRPGLVRKYDRYGYKADIETIVGDACENIFAISPDVPLLSR